MAVFSASAFDEHQEVLFCADKASGLRAIIAIHSRLRGPALGGCRMWPYATDDEALNDVLRLSRGMTYKAAMADLPFGGGKSVIIGDPRRDKSDALLQAMGRFVEALGGRYIIAEDSGTSAADMENVRRATRHVAGIAEGGAGDPSPATAFGVYQGIRAAILHRFGADDFTGLTVAVQGLGAVGRHLCRHLHDAGARLVVADIDPARAAEVKAEFDARVVAPDLIIDEPAEVFAPCALGAVINDETAPRLKTAIVAGAANNQLARSEHGRALAARSILYAPDFVINAGGIINIAHEGPSYDRQTAFRHVARIRETLLGIFKRAETEGVTPEETADRIARERLHAGTRAAA